MANISVKDPSVVSKLGKDIMAKSAEYQSEIKSVYNTIEDLKKKWTGTAASDFTGKIESYRKEYEDFGNLLNDFGKLLEEVGNAYQNVESNLKF